MSDTVLVTPPRTQAPRFVACRDRISHHVLYFAEINGQEGHRGVRGLTGRARERYFARVAQILRKTYGLSDAGIANLVAVWRRVDGPCKVRKELALLKIERSQRQRVNGLTQQ